MSLSFFLLLFLKWNGNCTFLENTEEFFYVSGVDHNLVSKILNPYHLSKISYTFSDLNKTIQMNGSWASVWVGEAGGAFNSGGKNVSDTFINSFWYNFVRLLTHSQFLHQHWYTYKKWNLCIYICVCVCRYLDQLGMAAKYNTKVYCRQTLIGGNYALLDTDTFLPNPDYYRHGQQIFNSPLFI